MSRTRCEAAACGSERLLKLLDESLVHPGIPEEWKVPDWRVPPAPVLPLELARGDLRLSRSYTRLHGR